MSDRFQSFKRQNSAVRAAVDSLEDRRLFAFTLSTSSYHGGSGDDFAQASVVDRTGNIYVAGRTSSTSLPGSLNGYAGGAQDAFVAKYDATGTRQWSRFIGGSADDAAFGIALDADGNLRIAGTTNSTDLASAANTNHGGYDAFVAHVTASGTLLGTAYAGGTANDGANAVAVNAANESVLVGYTASNDFEGRTNTWQGGNDGFVTRLSAARATLSMAYVGGSADDAFYGVAVNPAGEIYAGGAAASANVINRNNNAFGGGDGLLAKLSPAGTPAWTTYVGGTGADWTNGVAIDAGGSAVITGGTWSADFAGRLNTHHGNGDAYIAKITSSGVTSWGTLLGGSGYDNAQAIALDGAGNAYATGQSGSSSFDAQTNTKAGNYDAWLSSVNASGAIQTARFLGGAGYDKGFGLSVSRAGDLIFAGESGSADFPAATNTYAGGTWDAVVGLFPAAAVPATNEAAPAVSWVHTWGNESIQQIVHTDYVRMLRNISNSNL